MAILIGEMIQGLSTYFKRLFSIKLLFYQETLFTKKINAIGTKRTPVSGTEGVVDK